MTNKSTAQLALFVLLGVLTTLSPVSAQDRGRGGSRDSRSSAERFFGYMDRNRDGRLDAEETRRMPSSFREAFERADYNLDRGISRDDFVREMPRIMEDARRRREEEYRNRSRGDDNDRRREYYRRREEERRRGDDRRRDDDRRGGGYVYTPSKRERVTMEIPRRFEDGDTDKDGQIGLYEWRQWRPQEKYHFRVYDINGDGFLTPKELSIPPTQEEINNYLASIGVKVDTSSSSSGSGRYSRSRNGGSRGDSSPTPATPQVNVTVAQPKPVEEPAQDDRVTKEALVFFKAMDADKSGTITSEEWARSRTLKPKFEKAGYDLSQPMDQQQFIAGYRATKSES
jgi:Ca2+-binding EF-hand superfamily protein